MNNKNKKRNAKIATGLTISSLIWAGVITGIVLRFANQHSNQIFSKYYEYTKDGNLIIKVRLFTRDNDINQKIYAIFKDKLGKETSVLITRNKEVARIDTTSLGLNNSWVLDRIVDENNNTLINNNELVWQQKILVDRPNVFKVNFNKEGDKFFEIKLNHELSNQYLTAHFINQNNAKYIQNIQVDHNGNVIVGTKQLPLGNFYKFVGLTLKEDNKDTKIVNLDEISEPIRGIDKTRSFDDQGNVIINARVSQNLANQNINALFEDEKHQLHTLKAIVGTDGLVRLLTKDLENHHDYKLIQIVDKDNHDVIKPNKLDAAHQNIVHKPNKIKIETDKNGLQKALHIQVDSSSNDRLLTLSFENENHDKTNIIAKVNNGEITVDLNNLKDGHLYKLDNISINNTSPAKRVANLDDLNESAKTINKLNTNALNDPYHYDDKGNLIFNAKVDSKQFANDQVEAVFIDEKNNEHKVLTKVDLNGNIVINTSDLNLNHTYKLKHVISLEEPETNVLNDYELAINQKTKFSKPAAIVGALEDNNYKIQLLNPDLANKSVVLTFEDENHHPYQLTGKLNDQQELILRTNDDHLLPNNHTYTLTKITNVNNQPIVNVNDLDRKDRLLEKVDVNKLQQLNTYTYDDLGNLIIDINDNLNKITTQDAVAHFIDENNKDYFVPTKVDLNKNKISINTKDLDANHHYQLLNIVDKNKHEQILLNSNEINPLNRISIIKPLAIIKQDANKNLNLLTFDKNLFNRSLDATFIDENQKEYHVKAKTIIDSLGQTRFITSDEVLPNHHKYQLIALKYDGQKVINVADLDQKQIIVNKLNIGKIVNNQLVFDVPKNVEEGEDVFVNYQDVDGNLIKIPAIVNNKHQLQIDLSNNPNFTKDKIYHFDSISIEDEYHIPKETIISSDDVDNSVKTLNNEVDLGRKIIVKNPSVIQNKPTTLILTVNDPNKLVANEPLKLTLALKNDPKHCVSAYGLIDYKNNSLVFDFNHLQTDTAYYIKNLVFKNNNLNLTDLNAEAHNQTKINIIKDQVIGYTFRIFSTNTLVLEDYHQYDTDPNATKLNLNISTTNKHPKTITYRLLDENNNALEPDLVANLNYDSAKKIYVTHLQNLKGNSKYLLLGFNDENNNKIHYSTPIKTPLIFGTTPHATTINFDVNNPKQIIKSQDARIAIDFVDQDQKLSIGNPVELTYLNKNNQQVYKTIGYVKGINKTNKSGTLEFELNNLVSNNNYELLELKALGLANDAYQKVVFAPFDQEHNQFSTKLIGTYIESISSNEVIKKDENKLDVNVKIAFSQKDKTLNNVWAQLVYISKDNEVCLSQPLLLNVGNSNYKFTLTNNKPNGFLSNRVYKFVKLIYAQDQNDLQSSDAVIKNGTDLSHGFKTEPTGSISLKNNSLQVIKRTNDSIRLSIPLVDNDHVLVDSDGSLFTIKVSDLDDPNNLFDADNQKIVIDQNGNRTLEFDVPNVLLNHKYHINNITLTNKPINAAFNQNKNHEQVYELNNSQPQLSEFGNELLVNTYNYEPNITDAKTNVLNYKVKLTLKRSLNLMNEYYLKLKYIDNNGDVVYSDPVSINNANNEYEFNLPDKNALKSNRIYKFDGLYYFKDLNNVKITSTNKVNMNNITPLQIQTASKINLDSAKVTINNITPASADLYLPLVSTDDIFVKDQVIDVTIGNKDNAKNDLMFTSNLEYDNITKTWGIKIHANNLSPEVNYQIKSVKFRQKPVLGAFNVNNSDDNHVLIDSQKIPGFSTPKASFDLVSVTAGDVVDANVKTNSVHIVINNDGTSLNNCKAKIVYNDGEHDLVSNNFVVLNYGVNEYDFNLDDLKHNRIYSFKKLIYTEPNQNDYKFSFLNNQKITNTFKTASVSEQLTIDTKLVRKPDSNLNKINLKLQINDPNDFLEQDSVLEITFHDEKDKTTHNVIGKINVDANNNKTLEFSVENTNTFKIQPNHKYIVDNINYATKNKIQPANAISNNPNKNSIYDASSNPSKILSFTNELFVDNINVNQPNTNLNPTASIDVELKSSQNLLKDQYLRALYIDNNHQKIWSDYASVNNANLAHINLNFNHLTPNRKYNFAGIYYFNDQNQNNDETQGKKIFVKEHSKTYDFSTLASTTQLLEFKTHNVDEDQFNYDFSINNDDQVLEPGMLVELCFENLTDKNQPVLKTQTALVKKDEHNFGASGVITNLLADHTYRLTSVSLKQKPQLANVNINNNNNNEILLNNIEDNQKTIHTLSKSIVNEISNLADAYPKNNNGIYDVKFNINIIKNSNKLNNKYVKVVFEDNEHQLISTNGLLVNKLDRTNLISLQNFSFSNLKPNHLYRLLKVVYGDEQNFDAINEQKNILALNPSLVNSSFSTTPAKIKVSKNAIDVWQNQALIKLILDDSDNQLHSGDEININYRIKGTQNIISTPATISDQDKRYIRCMATNLIAGLDYEIVSVTIKNQKTKNVSPIIFELPSGPIGFYTLAPVFKITSLSMDPVYHENKNTADLKINLRIENIGASLFNKDIKFIFKRKNDGKQISFIHKVTSANDANYEWEFKDLLRNREYTLERVVYLKNKDFNQSNVSESDYIDLWIYENLNKTFKLLPTKPLEIIGAPIKEISDNGAKVQLKFAINDSDDVLKENQTFKFNIQPNENNGANLNEISEHEGKVEIIDGQKFFVANLNNIKVNKEYKVYKIYFDENQNVGNGVYKINFKKDYKEPNNVVYDASVNTTQTYVFTNKFAIASFSNNLTDVDVANKQNISINLDSRAETIQGYHFKAKYISNDNRVIWTNTIPAPTNIGNNKNNIALNFELNQNQLISNRLYTFAALYYSKDANVDENHANMVVIKNNVNPQTINTKPSSTYVDLKAQNADENKITLSLLLHSNDQIFEDKNNHLKIAKISIDELDAHDQIINSTTHDYDLTLEKENNEWLLKTQLINLKPNTKYRVKKVWFTSKPSDTIYNGVNKDNIVYPINNHNTNIDLKTLEKSTLNSVKPTKTNFNKNEPIKLMVGFNKTGSSLENKYAKLVYKDNNNQQIESDPVLLNSDTTTKPFNKEFSFNNNQTSLVANRDFEFVKLIISDTADFKNANTLDLTPNFNKDDAKFSIEPTPISVNNVIQSGSNTYDEIHLSFDYDDQDHNLVDNDQITITYRKKGEQAWTSSKAGEVSVKNHKINVTLKDLTPNTTYEIGAISTTHVHSPNVKTSPIQYNETTKKQLEKLDLTTKVAHNFIKDFKLASNSKLVNGVYECAKDENVKFSVGLHKEGHELEGYEIYAKFVDKTNPNKPAIEIKSSNNINSNSNQVYEFELLKSQITPNHQYELSEICAIKNKGANNEIKKDLNENHLSLALGLAPNKMDVQKPTITITKVQDNQSVSAHVKYIINDPDGILNSTDCSKELLNVKYALFNQTQNANLINNVAIKYDEQNKQFYCEFDINNLTLNQDYGIFEISFANKPIHAAFAKINDTQHPLALLSTNNQDVNQKIALHCEVNKVEINKQDLDYDQNTKISWPIELSSNLLNNKYIRVKYSVSGHKFKQDDQFSSAFKITNNKASVEIGHDKLIANKAYEIQAIYFSDQNNDFACTNTNQIPINSSITNKKIVINPSATTISSHEVKNITSTSADINCSISTNDGDIFKPNSQIIGHFAKGDDLTKTFVANGVVANVNNQTKLSFTLNNLEPNTKYTLVSVEFKQQPNNAYKHINNKDNDQFYSNDQTHPIIFTTSAPIFEINSIKTIKNTYASNKEEIKVSAKFNKIDPYLNAKKLKLVYQSQNNSEAFETQPLLVSTNTHDYVFSFDKNASNPIIGNREYHLDKILYLNEHNQWCELNKNNLSDQFSVEPTPISIAKIVEDDSKRTQNDVKFRIYFNNMNQDQIFNDNDNVNVKLVYPNTNDKWVSHDWPIHFDQQENKWYTEVWLSVGSLNDQEFEVGAVSINKKPAKAKFDIHKTNDGYDNFIYNKNIKNQNYLVGNIFKVNSINVAHPSTPTDSNTTVHVKMQNNMKSAFKGKYLALKYKRNDTNELVWSSTKIKIDENIRDDLDFTFTNLAKNHIYSYVGVYCVDDQNKEVFVANNITNLNPPQIKVLTNAINTISYINANDKISNLSDNTAKLKLTLNDPDHIFKVGDELDLVFNTKINPTTPKQKNIHVSVKEIQNNQVILNDVDLSGLNENTEYELKTVSLNQQNWSQKETYISSKPHFEINNVHFATIKHLFINKIEINKKAQENSYTLKLTLDGDYSEFIKQGYLRLLLVNNKNEEFNYTKSHKDTDKNQDNNAVKYFTFDLNNLTWGMQYTIKWVGLAKNNVSDNTDFKKYKLEKGYLTKKTDDLDQFTVRASKPLKIKQVNVSEVKAHHAKLNLKLEDQDSVLKNLNYELELRFGAKNNQSSNSWITKKLKTKIVNNEIVLDEIVFDNLTEDMQYELKDAKLIFNEEELKKFNKVTAVDNLNVDFDQIVFKTMKSAYVETATINFVNNTPNGTIDLKLNGDLSVFSKSQYIRFEWKLNNSDPNTKPLYYTIPISSLDLNNLNWKKDFGNDLLWNSSYTLRIGYGDDNKATDDSKWTWLALEKTAKGNIKTPNAQRISINQMQTPTNYSLLTQEVNENGNKVKKALGALDLCFELNDPSNILTNQDQFSIKYAMLNNLKQSVSARAHVEIKENKKIVKFHISGIDLNQDYKVCELMLLTKPARMGENINNNDKNNYSFIYQNSTNDDNQYKFKILLENNDLSTKERPSKTGDVVNNKGKVDITITQAPKLLANKWISAAYVDNNGETKWTKPRLITTNDNNQILYQAEIDNLTTNRYYNLNGLYFGNQQSDFEQGNATYLLSLYPANLLVPTDGVRIQNIKTPATTDAATVWFQLESKDQVFDKQVLHIQITPSNQNIPVFERTCPLIVNSNGANALLSLNNLEPNIEYKITKMWFEQKPTKAYANLNSKANNNVIYENTNGNTQPNISFKTKTVEPKIISLVKKDQTNDGISFDLKLQHDGTYIGKSFRLVYESSKRKSDVWDEKNNNWKSNDKQLIYSEPINFKAGQKDYLVQIIKDHNRDFKGNREYKILGIEWADPSFSEDKHHKKLIFKDTDSEAFKNVNNNALSFSTNATTIKWYVATPKIVYNKNHEKMTFQIRYDDPDDSLFMGQKISIKTFLEPNKRKQISLTTPIVGEVDNKKKIIEFNIDNNDDHFKPGNLYQLISIDLVYEPKTLSHKDLNKLMYDNPQTKMYKEKVTFELDNSQYSSIKIEENQNPYEVKKVENKLDNKNLKVKSTVKFNNKDEHLYNKYMFALFTNTKTNAEVWSKPIQLNANNYSKLEFDLPNNGVLEENSEYQFLGVYYNEKQTHPNKNEIEKQIYMIDNLRTKTIKTGIHIDVNEVQNLAQFKDGISKQFKLVGKNDSTVLNQILNGDFSINIEYKRKDQPDNEASFSTGACKLFKKNNNDPFWYFNADFNNLNFNQDYYIKSISFVNKGINRIIGSINNADNQIIYTTNNYNSSKYHIKTVGAQIEFDQTTVVKNDIVFTKGDSGGYPASVVNFKLKGKEANTFVEGQTYNVVLSTWDDPFNTRDYENKIDNHLNYDIKKDYVIVSIVAHNNCLEFKNIQLIPNQNYNIVKVLHYQASNTISAKDMGYSLKNAFSTKSVDWKVWKFGHGRNNFTWRYQVALSLKGPFTGFGGYRKTIFDLGLAKSLGVYARIYQHNTNNLAFKGYDIDGINEGEDTSLLTDFERASRPTSANVLSSSCTLANYLRRNSDSLKNTIDIGKVWYEPRINPNLPNSSNATYYSGEPKASIFKIDDQHKHYTDSFGTTNNDAMDTNNENQF